MKGTWTFALTVIVGYVGWLVAWYWPTLVSMASFWWNNSTYNHCLAVFPVVGWLIWRDRQALESVTPAPSTSRWPMLAMLAGAALWLGGDLADVAPGRQFGFVTVLIAGIWLIVGDRVARRIAFPLAFLYFAVPVGEVLLPTMIEWTADFTVWALRLSGVPVLREGMTFRIPSGSWSVVEACAGLRYLIASSFVGVLYAYIAYRSRVRRIAFVAASLIVPIVANWLRAYMIVMIGHLSDNKLAVGVDHILYGWLFFGIVMLLLFWTGSLWREDVSPATVESSSARTSLVETRADAVSGWTILVGAFLISALPPLAIQLLHRGDRPVIPIERSSPVLGDWHPIDDRLTEWTPRFTVPRTVIASTYARGDVRAGLYAAVYYAQQPDSKLVSSMNELVHTTDPGWHVISDRASTVDTPHGPLTVDESVLRIRDSRLLVRRWYWIDGVSTSSHLRAKLLQARARLLGRGDAGAIIVVYVPLPEEALPASAALDDLTRQAAASLPVLLAQRLGSDSP